MVRKRQLFYLIVALLAGLTACGWYGYQWHASTHWTRAQLENSVHLHVTDWRSPSGNSETKPRAGEVTDLIIQRLNKSWRVNRLYFFAALIFSLIACGLLIMQLARKHE